jgi:hypothetical protein
MHVIASIRVFKNTSLNGPLELVVCAAVILESLSKRLGGSEKTNMNDWRKADSNRADAIGRAQASQWHGWREMGMESRCVKLG